MKNLFTYLTITVLLLTTLSAPTSYAYESSFPDVEEDSRYLTAIEYLHYFGIFKGSEGEDGEFYMNPQSTINRAEFMAVIVRSQLEPDPEVYQNCFEDVTIEWYAPYICYAKVQGWVSGQGDGSRFEPGWNLNLAEAVKIIGNSQGTYDANVEVDTDLPYTDLTQDHWAYDYIAQAYAKNLLEETGSTLGLGDEQTREKIAEKMFRALVVVSTDTKVYDHEAYIEAMNESGLEAYVSDYKIYLAETYQFENETFTSKDFIQIAGQQFNLDSFGTETVLAISNSYEIDSDEVIVHDYYLDDEYVMTDDTTDDVYLFIVADPTAIGLAPDGVTSGGSGESTNTDGKTATISGDDTNNTDGITLQDTCLSLYDSFSSYAIYEGSSHNCSMEEYTATIDYSNHIEQYTTEGDPDLVEYNYFEEDTYESLEESSITANFIRLTVDRYDILSEEYETIYDSLLLVDMVMTGEYWRNRFYEETVLVYDSVLDEIVEDKVIVQEQGPYETFSLYLNVEGEEDWDRAISIGWNGYFPDFKLNQFFSWNDILVETKMDVITTYIYNGETNQEISETKDYSVPFFSALGAIDLIDQLGESGWDGTHGVSGETETASFDEDYGLTTTRIIRWEID